MCVQNVERHISKIRTSRDFIEDKLEVTYEGWNFNSGNYLFTADTK